MSDSELNEAQAAELAGLMESRAHVYALLSRIYEVEIDAAFAREMAEEFSFESDDAGLMREMGAMKACLADIDAAGIEELAVTFDRVFFGMGPLSATKAFPYESVYTSQAGLMMQDAYSETLKEYRREGLRKKERFTEPEDHLAVQLSFVRVLCDRAREALLAGDFPAAERAAREQRSFVNGHLANWIGRFAADACTAAEGGFYAHAARFTARFIEEDAAVLADMLD